MLKKIISGGQTGADQAALDVTISLGSYIPPSHQTKNLPKEEVSFFLLSYANLSLKLGYQIQDEKRLLTKDEAYEQISHLASLFKAISEYVGNFDY